MATDDYKFMPIVDAMTSLNQRVNIVGVVVDIGLPKHTKGTDVFRSIKIIDQSQPGDGFYLHFFADTMEKLPHVQTVGDVIAVYNVVVRPWDPGSYALYNKKFSSFAIFEGRGTDNKDPVPYQVSSRYRARYQDNKIIMDLKEWSIQNGIESMNELLPFKDIKVGESVDLFCKVIQNNSSPGKILHVCQLKENEWVLFLWDGSDTPPASIEATLEDEMTNPLPLQLEPSPLPRDTLCTFPPVGTVLRMLVDHQGGEKLGVDFLSPNRWVKFVHVKVEICSALWCAVLMPFSKFFYLPDDVDSVKDHLRLHNKRLASKWGRMPISSYPGPSHITETDHCDVPFATLMNVLTHPEVTYKFRCVVRVVAIFPWRAEDFQAPDGIYRIRLTLEDPTARIHAYLYGEDGEKFFGNFCCVNALTKMRNTLLGIADDDSQATGANSPRNPPWIQCCLKSYYIDKSDVWGSRNYQIFDTRMVVVDSNMEQKKCVNADLQCNSSV